MKVIRLKAQNIKKIVNADIRPEGNLVLVSGKNGQGKSSLLDCLLFGLSGKKAIPELPITKGKDRGEIQIKLDNGLLITRKFTEAGTYLKVTAADGAEYPKAQEMLNKLVGSLYFDPLEFAKLPAKDQKAMLLSILKVDISEEEELEKSSFDERTFVKRTLSELESQTNSVPATEEELPAEPVDISSLLQESKQQQQLQEELDNQAAEVEINKDNSDEVTTEIEDLKRELEKKEKEKAELIQKHKQSVEAFEKMVKSLKVQPQERIDQIQNEILEAGVINSKIETQQRSIELLARANKLKENIKELDDVIQSCRDSKVDKLMSADVPVDGLSVTMEGVNYNGIPFGQLATSEQIKVSLAIAMAQDSELKLIRIMDGSLLDSDNLEAIEELVTKNDYQCWVEIVKSESGVGFYIENGEVKK